MAGYQHRGCYRGWVIARFGLQCLASSPTCIFAVLLMIYLQQVFYCNLEAIGSQIYFQVLSAWALFKHCQQTPKQEKRYTMTVEKLSLSLTYSPKNDYPLLLSSIAPGLLLPSFLPSFLPLRDPPRAPWPTPWPRWAGPLSLHHCRLHQQQIAGQGHLLPGQLRDSGLLSSSIFRCLVGRLSRLGNISTVWWFRPYKPYIFWKHLIQGYQNWYYQVSHTQIHKYKYTNTQI